MHLIPETCLCNFIRMLRYLAQTRPHANQRAIDLKASGGSALVDGTRRPGASGKYSAAHVPTAITGRLRVNSLARSPRARYPPRSLKSAWLPLSPHAASFGFFSLHCRKERFERAGGFPDFCFLCFAWIDRVEAWSEHTKQHGHNVPLKCSLAMFRGTVLRPAWCPDCMGQTGNPGSDGKCPIQFLNVTAWKAHMDKHVHELRPGPHKCSHPRCAHLPGCASIAEYVAHRFDVHLIPAPDGAVNGTARWTNASDDEPVDDGAYRVATRFHHSRRPRSPQPSSQCEVFSQSSTQAGTCSSPEGSSPCADPRNSVFAEEGAVSGGNDKDTTALPASKTKSDADCDQACHSWADQWSTTMKSLPSSISSWSSSSCGPATKRRQQSRSSFRNTPPKSIKSNPTTIEVRIPSRPQGWENVPLVNCTGCTDESTDEDTACEEVAPDGTVVGGAAVQAAQFSQPTSCFSKGSMSAMKPGIGAASGIRTRTLEKAVVSERWIRRRNAITEMHARIRERRRPRLKIAATTCA